MKLYDVDEVRTLDIQSIPKEDQKTQSTHGTLFEKAFTIRFGVAYHL